MIRKEFYGYSSINKVCKYISDIEICFKPICSIINIKNSSNTRIWTSQLIIFAYQFRNELIKLTSYQVYYIRSRQSSYGLFTNNSYSVEIENHLYIFRKFLQTLFFLRFFCVTLFQIEVILKNFAKNIR